MKILYIVCTVFLLLTGCSQKKEEKKVEKPKKDKEVSEPVKETYKDSNDVKLGIYKFYNNAYNLTKDYGEYWNQDKDVSYYSIFFSNEEAIYSNWFVSDFNKYKGNFNSNVKIGYEFSFESVNGPIKKTILCPQDVWDIFGYIQIYLYDDIAHQNESWYSHTEQDQVNENTLFTTFKITMGNPALITSDIKVTAFTYDSDDDFKDSFYRGDSSYTFYLKRL